ncbi:MAG: hypothetical protein V7K68_17495 [Nostoc sp.]|uniref:hypothetical protein n=1 Tax=Nostoc sp. TaxID=1180 RepID=UPI002FF686E6
MNHSLHMMTQRLELLPCSLQVAQAAGIKNKSQVERLLGVGIPNDWCTSEVQDLLFKYTQILAGDV